RPRHAPRPARATERRWALVGAGGALGHRLSVCLGSGDRPGPQRARAPDAADAVRRGPHRRRDRRRPRPRRRVSGARPRTHHGVAGRLRRGGVDHRRQVARALQAARGPRIRRVLSGRHPRLLLARRARRRGDPDPAEAGLTPLPPAPRNPPALRRVTELTDAAPCPLLPARSPVDERELIAKVRAGDGAAERALYDAHVDRVYRLAYRLAGDDDLAREFTQDTFVRAFDRLGTFRGEAKLSTWLHAIATSVVLNGLRKVKRFRQRETDLDEAAGTSAGRRAAEPDLKRRLARATDGPPEAPPEALWHRSAPARAARKRQALVVRSTLRWGVGIAAVLALGVAIGRGSARRGESPSSPTVIAGSDQASTLAYRVAAAQYLTRTEALLTGFRAEARSPSVPAARFSRQARDLLATTRLMLD